VTGQPDWATVWVHYRGAKIDQGSLLRYIIAYRRHQEFHEQCVERMFIDIWQRCSPEFLHIQAFYTRRGGLDINPFRSTDPAARPLPRLNRQ
jgi:7-cyano-7-deazaguanine reductase